MSRSYKKAIVKDRGCRARHDRGGKNNCSYNRVARHTWSQITRELTSLTPEGLDTVEYPNVWSLVNPWDVRDWKFDYEHDRERDNHIVDWQKEHVYFGKDGARIIKPNPNYGSYQSDVDWYYKTKAKYSRK